MSWDRAVDAPIVMISTEATDEASAAQALTGAVADSLRVAGLQHLYPAQVELEAVAAPAPAA